MNNTDKRQMTDELIALGKSGQHNSTFIKAVKGAFTFKDVQKILDEKRRAYNYAYTNVFKKYNVIHNDLYSDLDRIWNICVEEEDPSKRKNKMLGIVKSSTAGFGTGASLGMAAPVAAAAGGAVALSLPLTIGVLTAPIGIFLIAKVAYKVNKFWNAYKDLTLSFAESYISSI
jgi:hypothetical protein